MSLPSAVASSLSATNRRRIVVLLTALALALTTFISPALSTKADAAQPRLTAKMTASFAQSMLSRLNNERKKYHRPALRMNVKLIKSAHAHNLAMAKADSMSHQLPGEAFFADRISKAGYNWQSAGENIGWNSDLSRNGVLYLQHVMFLEKAPNDGHRVNILNTSFREIGIDVYYDAKHGKVWFTQDFGQPMR